MTQPKKRRTQREMFEAWVKRAYFVGESYNTGPMWDAWQAAVRANRRKRT